MKKKVIGFYGGTFDPIHFGHIYLAIEMLENHGLDEILFCPAFCSPFKTGAPPIASAHQRLDMVRLAIESIPHFHLSSIEIDREGPSYTIDTIRALQDLGTFRLILTDETAQGFDQWKESEELRRLAPPLIGMRGKTLSPWLPEDLRKGMKKTPLLEISSTQIRERLKKNLYCGHLTYGKVLDYIHALGLYSKIQ